MANDILFQPLQMGPISLPNRVMMAPLTRCRSQQPGDIPRALNARYYAQRASAGFILTEATQISPQGKGYAYTPGIHSDAQVDGWRLVTDSVHAAGGRIFLQLWHVGRMSHVEIQQNGQSPVAPSAINAGSRIYLGDKEGYAPTSDPRALETEEIPGIVADYKAAAQRAQDAGFDGVELHGANGYLIHQFLSDTANQRTDRYGGSVENRIRLAVEVVEALVEVWGPERVGVRLSPERVESCGSSDALSLYTALIKAFNRIGIAFLDIVEYFGAPEDRPSKPSKVQRAIREGFKGLYFANGGYLGESARGAINQGHADGVIFGTTFLANPDLPERLRRNAELNTPNRDTFYGGDAEGYTDYETLG